MATRRNGILAFAKQTAFGTPASAPTVAVPYAGGGGPKAVRDMGDLPLTRASSARAGQFIQRARAEGSPTILAHQEIIGLLLMEAMGAQAVTGVADPFVHKLTMADDFPATPLTVWAMQGGDWWKFSDVVVQSIGIRAASGDNVLIDLGLYGRHYTPHVTAPSLAGILLGDEPRFKYIGTVAKLDADSDTPTVMTNVENVALTIARTVTARYGTELTPQLMIPSRDVDFSAGITFDPLQQGWDFVTTAKTGTAAGTAETQAIGRGSFDIIFGRHPSESGAPSTKHSLRFYSGPPTTGDAAPFEDNWEYDADVPDPDPGGGPIDLTAAGRVIDPPGTPGGSELTVIVQDTHSGLY